MFWRGGRVWLIALVLKTSIPQGIGGSNPSPSAIVYLIVKDGEVSDSFIDCNPNLDRVVDIQEGSYKVLAKICDDPPLDIMLPFKIGLMTMDDNYYQYFIKGEGNKYNNFLLGSETSAGYSVGIQGALGVFGSIASTMTTVLIK